MAGTPLESGHGWRTAFRLGETPSLAALRLFSRQKKADALTVSALCWLSKKRVYFFFALGFGMSVMLPSNNSAARPIDSFNVG